jgi:hypothetical protein
LVHRAQRGALWVSALNAARNARFALERVAVIGSLAIHSNGLMSHARGAQNRFPLLRNML